MPQNPNQVLPGKNPSNTPVPLNTDAAGNLGTALKPDLSATQPAVDGLGSLRASNIPGNSALNVAVATVVKASPGKVHTAQLIVGGSTPGAIHDCLTTAAAATSNQIAALPPLTTAQIGALTVDMIAKIGIVAIPGTGQTVAISFE